MGQKRAFKGYPLLPVKKRFKHLVQKTFGIQDPRSILQDAFKAPENVGPGTSMVLEPGTLSSNHLRGFKIMVVSLASNQKVRVRFPQPAN